MKQDTQKQNIINFKRARITIVREEESKGNQYENLKYLDPNFELFYKAKLKKGVQKLREYNFEVFSELESLKDYEQKTLRLFFNKLLQVVPFLTEQQVLLIASSYDIKLNPELIKKIIDCFSKD